MKNLSLIAVVAALLISSSCGKKSGGGNAPAGAGVTEAPTSEPAAPQVEETAAQVLEGSYEALLRPLNSSVSGFLPSGRTNVSIAGGIFKVKNELTDNSRVTHIQSIHEGRRCPTLADDANGDGLIDVIEMKKAVGNVLIPLDGDLSSQLLGQESYPIGKETPRGKEMKYEKSAQMNLIFEDLYRKDLPQDTSFAKLADGAPLNLEGRVVMVHGTANFTRVPESVQTLPGVERNVAIPITCGVLRRK